MGRPKGSKNKTEEVKAEVVETNKPVGHSVTVLSDPWTPSPDMGKVVPPEESESICECLHKKAVHYGPERDWCNTGGCQCQTFSLKAK